MASLQGNAIKDTYKSLLKVADNGELEATAQEITDGDGNGTGVSLNTSGDVIATGTVAFASLKDSGENITITKFVDEADGIGNNDNDSSIPTSAAVRDYVDNNITAQDLDITDGVNVGAVDLDSQFLQFAGLDGTTVTVAGNLVSIDSSGLQAQITSNDDDIVIIEARIDAEEAARLAADNTLQSNINAEAVTRANADTTLQSNINAEAASRAAADLFIEDLIDAENAARVAADNTLQSNIDAESIARSNADVTLQANISAESTARQAADANLQNQINSNDADILGLDTRLTAAEGDISSNDTDIASLDGRLTTAESNIASNDTDISGLNTRLTTAEGNISSNDTDIAALDTRLTTAESNITSNDSDISGLDTRLTTAEGNITTLTSSKQSISEKGQPNGYAPLDSGAKVPEANLPDSILGQVQYDGTWDASTNTPTLPDPTIDKGHYYVVSVAGTYLGTDYAVGDWIISNGTSWEKVDNSDAVTTVFGRIGNIVANEADYAAFYAPLADYNTTASQVSTNTTKLATIEIGADVTDAANVAAAGALMSGTAVINDLADVSVSSPSNGQVLSYNSTSGQWEAGSAAAAPVDSVNGQIGAVVLDADDIDDILTTNKFTTAADISKLAGIEAGAQVNTVDSVNSQTGVVVLDADDIDDTATLNKFTTQVEIDKLAGIEAGADITDVANVTAALGTISVTAHSDVTSAGSGAIITSAERTKLQGIETGADVTDTANVVAALSAGSNITIGLDGTISATDTNTTYTAGAGLSLSSTTFSHADTSSAGNLAASGRRYVTGLTFDTYGHVTAYTTGTETVVDTNTTYSAGSGLTLSGTTFSVQNDLRGEAWIIGRDNNDYINVDTTQIDFALDGAIDMRLYNNGDLHVEGNVIGYSTSISDQKFKDDVTPIESALDKVKALKGVEFTWNATSKKGKRDIGFIAQEVEKIVPEVVTEVEMGVGEFANDPTTSKSVAYDKLTAILVEAIKEQQKQIDELKAKLDGITN